MNERDMFDEHPDMAAIDKSVEQAWRRTAGVMADATFEVTGAWQEPGDGFWEKNSAFISEQSPEVAEAIFLRAEEITASLVESETKNTNYGQLKSFGRNILKRFFK